MPQSYRPCPVCGERKRTDSMKSHLYCQHGKKDVHRWVSEDVLAEAIAKKIPMIWKIAKPLRNESYEDIDYKKKIGDFCICLVCKDSRYYKEETNIMSDVAAFYKHHLKTRCMTQWNSVASRYGVVVKAECIPIVSPTVETAMDRVMKENAELKAENAMLKTAFNDAMTENELLLKQLAIQLPAP